MISNDSVIDEDVQQIGNVSIELDPPTNDEVLSTKSTKSQTS